MDFDSEEIQEYPDVHGKVVEGSLEPGAIIIDEKLQAMDKISYADLVEAFEKLGIQRLKEKAS
ncbi:MAG: hypothetical protein WC911_03990 [Thermoleophilia bacterium]